MTLLTIILPTYNRGIILQRAIDSILNQSFKDFRLEIWDNNSNDQTYEIVSKYIKQDSRVKYNRRDTNIGLVKNFSDPLKTIQTPFFCFLSDDDFWLPKFLDECFLSFKQQPKAKFVMTNWNCADQSGFKQKTLIPPGHFDASNGLKNLIIQFPFLFSCVFKSEILQTTGGFKTDIGAFFDVEFILKCAVLFPYTISKSHYSNHQHFDFSVTSQVINHDQITHYRNLMLLIEMFYKLDMKQLAIFCKKNLAYQLNGLRNSNYLAFLEILKNLPAAAFNKLDYLIFKGFNIKPKNFKKINRALNRYFYFPPPIFTYHYTPQFNYAFNKCYVNSFIETIV